MSFQPSPDTARQCAEKNKEGSKRNGMGVTIAKKKRPKKSGFFASTLAHSTISMKWEECGGELSLWPFSGEGILPKPFALTGKEQHVILHLIATVSSYPQF